MIFCPSRTVFFFLPRYSYFKHIHAPGYSHIIKQSLSYISLRTVIGVTYLSPSVSANMHIEKSNNMKPLPELWRYGGLRLILAPKKKKKAFPAIHTVKKTLYIWQNRILHATVGRKNPRKNTTALVRSYVFWCSIFSYFMCHL